MLEIDDQLLAEARAGRRAAVPLIASLVPEAFAIATLLTGSYDVGRRAIKHLTVTSMKALPKWVEPTEPRRWFRHHAVLVARELPTVGRDDPTIFAPPGAALPEGFAAFIRAVRSLHPQQQEAFLLHHGLAFSTRDLGIAMDCSTTAASTHLDGATRELRPLTREQFDAMLPLLRDGARRLLNVEDPTGFVARRYRRITRRRGAERMLTLLVTLAAIGGIGWLAWSFRGPLQSGYEQTREWVETRLAPAATQPAATQPAEGD
jgi:DNA-directed RNA polymerase specialized sigma24 family protein